MWRSRARLGLCAVVVALAWAAAPVARAATADDGTLQISASTVQASAPTTLAFSYTAPVDLPSLDVTVTVDLPPDWTASAPATVSCRESACAVTTDSSTQIVVQMNLDVASAFVLSYPATAPGFATTSSFTATEQFASDPPTTDQLAPLPVMVNCPDDGTGMMVVSPSAVTASSSRTLTFTYTAGSCGVGAGGLVAVTVPGSWTTPNMTAGQPGFASWAGQPASVTGSMITVPVGSLAPGQQVSFYYEMAQVPGSAVGYTFDAAEQSGADGSPQPLAVSPEVMVTPAVATNSASASSSASASVSSSASASVSSSPSVSASGGGTSRHGSAGGLPVALVLGLVAAGLVVAAGAASLLVSRLLHRGGHGTGGGNVRAVPHSGPPPSVAVRDTGTRPTLTVHLEPHAGATVTTIEEKRP